MSRTRSRPVQAIESRQKDSNAKVAEVEKAVKRLGRIGVPITRVAVAQAAGVSRSFTYENLEARAIISAAQSRSDARATGRRERAGDQQEASWRERALNAEDHARELRRELKAQRQLVSDLAGQLRDPDGTSIRDEVARLRGETEILLAERNGVIVERDELRRKLEASRANLSRVNERRVAELFPDGPSPTKRLDAGPGGLHS